MMVDTLFEGTESVGVFKGFVEGGMEFHADLVLPYRQSINEHPMHGMYLLIQLENPNEAVLGRITSVASDGKLASGAGEDYNIRAAQGRFPVPEDLKEQYLKYRVNVRVLGGLKLEDGKVVFVPSFRRIPSVGSPVSFPSNDVMRELANSNSSGTKIGLFALGEYIYAGDKAEEYGLNQAWMNIRQPEIPVMFDVNAMVARRTFVFARAGFGKSNLNKLLFSQLYQRIPMKKKGGDREVPVGTVIFDRDGEYFWPDDNGRPGFCDVGCMRENLVVFTNRAAPSFYYGSFVASNIKLDLRRLPASVVISLAISEDRQEQQNIKKLKGLGKDSWSKLVDLIYRDRYGADVSEVSQILHIKEGADAEANAAISNITNVVNMLHDPNSLFLDSLLLALKDGRLCIVDMSQLGSDQALVLSGLILNRIFENNQDEFTKASPETIPTIAVLEEAQSVLSPGKNATAPFISWVKEGRKYDLGALMITQQPGSISTDILSQGDNWFVFHLLSDKDLQDVRRANAHFSNDLQSSLLNEPIVGQGVFWSSVPIGREGPKPYPIPVRILSFERMYHRYQGPDVEVDTYAKRLKEKVAKLYTITDEAAVVDLLNNKPFSDDPFRNMMIQLKESGFFKKLLFNDKVDYESHGIPWGKMLREIEKCLNPEILDKNEASRAILKYYLDSCGKENEVWRTERKGERGTVFLFIRPEII